MIKTYITNEDFQVYPDHRGNAKILPAGSFVKPIDIRYLPTYIKEKSDFKWHNSDRNMYVYCHFGIIEILKSIVREA